MNDGPQTCLKKFISFQKPFFYPKKKQFFIAFYFLNVMKPFHQNVMKPKKSKCKTYLSKAEYK